MKLDKKPIAQTEGGALAKLFRKIVKDTNSANALGYLLSSYLDRPDSQVSGKKKTKSSMEGNILSNNMMWNILISLMFDIFNIPKIKVVIEIWRVTRGSKPYTYDAMVHNPNTLSDKSKKAIKDNNALGKILTTYTKDTSDKPDKVKNIPNATWIVFLTTVFKSTEIKSIKISFELFTRGNDDTTLHTIEVLNPKAKEEESDE